MNTQIQKVNETNNDSDHYLPIRYRTAKKATIHIADKIDNLNGFCYK